MDENEELRARLKRIQIGPIDEVSKEYSIPKKVLEKAREADRKAILSDYYPYEQRLSRKEYELQKRELQIELVKLQRWVERTGQKVVIVFEGRDAAGKGGTIKRFTEHLNPRVARVVALLKPTEQELGEWYFQRYIRQLPTNGEIVFFDRSWYNRAGVERVMGFCNEAQYNTFVEQVGEFEKMIINSGTHLIKFWFSISRVEQLRRFFIRTTEPLKQWKLSPMDVESLARWDSYTEAKLDNFEQTDTKKSPWVVVRSDDKKRARLNAMRYVIDQFEYTRKEVSRLADVDKKILGRPKELYQPAELERGFESHFST